MLLTTSRYQQIRLFKSPIFPTTSDLLHRPPSSDSSRLSPTSHLPVSQLMPGAGRQRAIKGKHRALYVHQRPSAVTTAQASSSTRAGQIRTSTRTLSHVLPPAASTSTPTSTPTSLFDPSDSDVVVNDDTDTTSHSAGITITPPSKRYSNSVSRTHVQCLLV